MYNESVESSTVAEPTPETKPAEVMDQRLFITKVKVDKKDRIHIEYKHGRKKPTDRWNLEDMSEFVMACKGRARSQFYSAMKALVDHVPKIIEQPRAFTIRLSIKGVSFGYGGDDLIMGASINCCKDLMTSNTPWYFNTPYKSSELYSEQGDEESILDNDCIEALENLLYEAELYIKGHRAESEQPDLFGPHHDREDVVGLSRAVVDGARKLRKMGVTLSSVSAEAE